MDDASGRNDQIKRDDDATNGGTRICIDRLDIIMSDQEGGS
jgi:hypothetical protein